MPKPRSHDRLNKIEVELTPEEWAIRLIDEIRRYPNEHEFLRAIAAGTYRESPYIKPFFALAAQAENRFPGQKPPDLRARKQLSADLRTEYHALKSLINCVNEEVESKAELTRLKGAALAIRLDELILRDAFVQTTEVTAAWIERHRDAGAEEQKQSILENLDNVRRAATSAGSLHSLARDWADDAAILLVEIFVQKAAMLAVQRKCFRDHPILFPSVESALETTVQQITNAVGLFNEYVRTKAIEFTQNSGQRVRSEDEIQPAVTDVEEAGYWNDLGIDVEEIRSRAGEFASQSVASTWETAARDKGIADVLRETGEHESVVWGRFRESVGMNRLAQ